MKKPVNLGIDSLLPLVDTDAYNCSCGRPSEMCSCGDYDDEE